MGMTLSAPLVYWLGAGPSYVPLFPAADLSRVCLGILPLVQELEAQFLLPDLVCICVPQTGSFHQLLFNYYENILFFLLPH